MASTIEPPRHGRTRILLACGNPELAQTARNVLKTAGFRRVLGVTTGDDALNALSQGGVEVLLTVVDLPDINAWRLTRLVRSGEYGPSAPVVVVHEGHPAKILETMAHDEGVAIASLDEPGQLATAINAAISNGNKPTLLAIEDDKRAGEVLRDGLQSDFDVEIAYDGETGVAAWQVRRHRLIVLDYKLPGISGGEALQQILAINRIQPVVMLTADVSANRRHDLVFAGAAEFVAKPYEVEQLRRICERVLRHAELMETDTEVRKKEETMHEFANRLYAADRFLGMGKVGVAASHVKEALRDRHHSPPTEDDWKKLFREFDR